MPGAITPCQYLNMLASEHPDKLTPAMKKRLANCNPSTASALEQDLLPLLAPFVAEQTAARAGALGTAGLNAAKSAGSSAAKSALKHPVKAAAAGGVLAALNTSAISVIIIRIGELILGAALLLLGLKALTGGDGSPITAAKKVLK